MTASIECHCGSVIVMQSSRISDFKDFPARAEKHGWVKVDHKWFCSTVCAVMDARHEC